MEYNFEYVGTSKDGLKLYRDVGSHIYALCNSWEEPTDASAFLIGITEHNIKWANEVFFNQ